MKKILMFIFLAVMFSGCVTGRDNAGSQWSALDSLSGGKVEVELIAKNKSYEVGESMSFTVKSEASGRLWLVSVGPKGELSLIFPNENSSDNAIKAEVSLSLPPEEADWQMVAARPTGDNLVVALVTGPFIDKGRLMSILSADGKTIASELERESPKWGSAKTIVKVR